jgi:acetyl esterase/lipase
MKRTSVHYGSQHAQVADLWRPDRTGELPVVVLIHGGFWRQLYTKRLMQQMAKAVVAQGWVAYNIEYRRVGALGSGGWPATLDDTARAVDALADQDGIDLSRVVSCGHSAGGHLALWAAGRRRTETSTDEGRPKVGLRAAISLAGVVDLVAAARQGVGGGAVDSLMGGSPDQHPERYALGSPAALLPLGIPQVLIHGLRDTTVPASLSETYVERARSSGDDATYLPLPDASHMDMIDVQGKAFEAVVACLDRFSASGS